MKIKILFIVLILFPLFIRAQQQTPEEINAIFQEKTPHGFSMPKISNWKDSDWEYFSI